MSKKLYKHCPKCNSLMNAREKTCPFCAAKQISYLEWKIRDFLLSLLPKEYPATKLILGTLILYFIMVSLAILQQNATLSQIIWSPPGEILWKWGAHARGDFTPWRLITANFLHIGLMHIAFNGYALWVIGPTMEKMYGTAITIASFVLLGTASMTCSNILGDIGLVAGASGSLMGYIGMVAAAGHRTRLTNPNGIHIRNAMIKWAAMIMLFGIIISLSSSTMGVDNIAHISGFIAGAILGLLVPLKENLNNRFAFRIVAILLIISLAMIAWATTQMLQTVLSQQSATECIADIEKQNYKKAVDSCQKALDYAPYFVGSYNNLALAYYLSNDTEEAIKICKIAKDKFGIEHIKEAKAKFCEKLDDEGKL